MPTQTTAAPTSVQRFALAAGRTLLRNIANDRSLLHPADEADARRVLQDAAHALAGAFAPEVAIRNLDRTLGRLLDAYPTLVTPLARNVHKRVRDAA